MPDILSLMGDDQGARNRQIEDHPFRPSKRPDSCDFTYWQADGPWLVCDYPEAAHTLGVEVPA